MRIMGASTILLALLVGLGWWLNIPELFLAGFCVALLGGVIELMVAIRQGSS